MLKLVLLVSCVGFVVAYDFKDSFYNEVLLQDMLDDSEPAPLFGRVRRSPSEDSMDDKCSKQRRYKCCNDANGDNMDKIQEIKKQCFTEVRNKNKAEGTYEPMDMFSCERLNRTKMEVICAMECLGRRKEVVNDAGDLLEPKLNDFVKVNFAADEWQQPLIAGQVETCLKEVKEKAAKQPHEAGQCNPAASNFGYCMWRQMAKACPKEKQVAGKRCERMRERLANNEPLHYYKAELDD